MNVQYTHDKATIYHLQQKLKKAEEMIRILQMTGCATSASTREKLMEAERLSGTFNVYAICDALMIARGTFYNHMLRNPRDAAWFITREQDLTAKVSEVFESGNQCYGAAKIAAILRKGGTATSERKVAAIMHETGMSSIRTNSKAVYRETMRSTPNIVKQRFSVDEPNTVWVSDITEFKFGGRKYHICIVLDLFARAVVGCRIGTRGSTQLVKSTFVQTHNTRKPNAGLIFHRDRGGPYRSRTMTACLRTRGVVQSYSRPHKPFDNSPIEAFNRTLKAEELYRRIYRSEREFFESVFKFVDFYNTARPHKANKNNAPAEKERNFPSCDGKLPSNRQSFSDFSANDQF